MGKADPIFEVKEKVAHRIARREAERQRKWKLKKQAEKKARRRRIKKAIWEMFLEKASDERIKKRYVTRVHNVDENSADKGWDRLKRLRGWKIEMIDQLKNFKPEMVIPSGPSGGSGDGETLRGGSTIHKASESLSILDPMYSEALRRYRVVQVSTGLGHTILCTACGVCISYGSGSDGLLGHGSWKSSFCLNNRGSGRKFIAGVAAGHSHSCCIGAHIRRYLRRRNERGSLALVHFSLRGQMFL